ncbi:histidine phosphatase family protein [Marinobacter oulmenensis]|uniref:Alpha-ribazole phosphatase n=1 Tax=Marinobacter oulmenensis TaxID=643747 RepID=A0A840U5R8_9GAMM|nr:alpha-ribazole phosphatase family protein [Marinobacter oulmenensis]MBB5321054.1 alpha-ribazole phosphatase [Marinobacter oulmenensis]
MTTTVLDLIRHGEPQGGPMFRGRKDDPLSEDGWNQMHAAITSQDQWHAIVTSPLLRCREFAGQLSERLGLPIHVEQELQEIRFGEWEGLTSEQVHDRYGEHLSRFWQDPVHFTPPGGEPMAQFHERVARAFRRWQEQLAGQRVLVVCHGGVIRMILADVLGIPLERSFAGFAVPYACRSRIQVDQSEFRVFRSLISHCP